MFAFLPKDTCIGNEVFKVDLMEMIITRELIRQISFAVSHFLFHWDEEPRQLNIYEFCLSNNWEKDLAYQCSKQRCYKFYGQVL